jgi:two-component system response regulator YesN
MAVIIISGYENFQYAQRALSYGVNKYLLKPVNREELQDALFEAMVKLTEIEKMNHYFNKIQTFFDTINDIDPAEGLKSLYQLVDNIRTIKHANYGAYLSLLRIVESKISSLLTSIESEHSLMSHFSGVPDPEIRQHLGKLAEAWFLHPERNKKEFKQIIKSACDFIHTHYQDDLTLTQMAEYTGVSISHFSSLFKRYTGESLVSYINEVRVEKAKELLRNSYDKIYLIAEKVGFSSQPYFIRVFRNVTGMSPNEYRKSMGI